MIQPSLHQHLDEIYSPNQGDLHTSKSPSFLLCVKVSPWYLTKKCILLFHILSFIILSYNLTLISKVIDG
jgi:hypothetical protein